MNIRICENGDKCDAINIFLGDAMSQKKICHKSRVECLTSDSDECKKYRCNYDMEWLLNFCIELSSAVAFDKPFSVYTKSNFENFIFDILTVYKRNKNV